MNAKMGFSTLSTVDIGVHRHG